MNTTPSACRHPHDPPRPTPSHPVPAQSASTPSETRAWRPWTGVAAITASLFTFVTTELMPIGLLTPMGSGLGASVGATGLLVTLFGVSAGLGAPFLVAWTGRVDRRVLLPALLAVLAAGNLATALAPGFVVVLAARLTMGFANGVFWAIGVSMAMRLVPERHSGRAAAIALSGISAAAVVGIPLGTFLADLTTWRTTFVICAGVAALVGVAVAVVLPALPGDGAAPVREVLRLPVRNRRLRAVLIAVALYVLGHFGAYTFVRPWLEQNAAASAAFVAVLLVVFGLGGVLGNVVAGQVADRDPRTGLVLAGAGIAVSLALLLVAGGTRAGALVALGLWGLSFGAANLCQVTLMLRAAPDTFESAMSINTLGYNVSIALGAVLGGLVTESVGVGGVVWLGIILAAASVLVALRRPRG